MKTNANYRMNVLLPQVKTKVKWMLSNMSEDEKKEMAEQLKQALTHKEPNEAKEAQP